MMNKVRQFTAFINLFARFADVLCQGIGSTTEHSNLRNLKNDVELIKDQFKTLLRLT